MTCALVQTRGDDRSDPLWELSRELAMKLLVVEFPANPLQRQRLETAMGILADVVAEIERAVHVKR